MKYFASGDGPFFYSEQLASMDWFPRVWDRSIDFGVNILPRFWIDYPFHFFVKLLSSLGLGWGSIDKILWAGAAIIGAYSIYVLSRKFVGRVPALFSILIYLTNTYALFLFGGGQLGVALAYGLSPLILLKFSETIQKMYESHIEIHTLRKLFVANGLLLSLLIIFDLRIAYIILGAISLFGVCGWITTKKTDVRTITLLILSIFIPIGIAMVLHTFWILPILAGGRAGMIIGDDFTNPGMLKFLSFADFSHALSLLHPNWPENLFGKVYFLQPEFLILPILSFSALFFVKNVKKYVSQTVVFFTLLTLIGAFMAKGVQPPFGQVFSFMFEQIPGFVMFRDPTKFYILTALGFAVLVPFTLESFSLLIKKISWMPWIFFILFWCFTVRQLFLGDLTGNFKPKEIPLQYTEFKNFLLNDTKPSRVLWVPSKEKFGYASNLHPGLSSQTLFHNASISGLMNIATSASFMDSLDKAGVRYVVVPEDLDKTIFLSEYKFDTSLRDRLIQTFSTTHLIPIPGFQDIRVFENPSFTKADIQIPASALKQDTLVEKGRIISIIGLIIGILLVWF